MFHAAVPLKLHQKSSTPAPAPNAFTRSPWAGSLLFALILILLTGSRAFAQEPQLDRQTDGYGSGLAASDTIAHTPRAVIPAFTDSPRRQEPAAEGKMPEAVHADGQEDDYDNNTPTAWWVYTGQTIAQISSLISSNNARIIDLQVDTITPSYTFTVTMVSNTGAYAKGWWWYVGETQAQVSSLLSTNNARLISLKAYDIGGGNIRFAVVMISNTGADGKGWWWYDGQSISGISSLLSTNHARLIAVDPYTTGGKTYYTAIMVSATGADNVAWWWYVNASPSSIETARVNNNARIFYITPGTTSGTFNTIMESCSGGCSEWWYYYGQTGTQMVNTAVQNGARLVSFNHYAGCGGECFVGAMINNSNAITTRVGNMLRNGVGGGTQGLYLRQVNGATLANLEDNVVYEPASSIKVVANLYAQHRVENGNIALTTKITHYSNGADSCPNPPVVAGTETLGLALREMMFHSDNARTREITDHFTDANINAYAASIGMAHTSINHYIGCGGPTPDQLTLDDAATLYEAVDNQTVLNSANRGIFYSNMAGRAQYEAEGYDWTGIWSTDIPNIINEVAPAGTTAAQKAAYMAAMNVAYKAGNYVLCPSGSCNNVVEDIAITGWFQLPTCSATATTYADYVWGIYFSNVPYSGWSNGTVTPADNDFTTAKGELLREQIQAGMASCNGRTLNVVTFNEPGLVFSPQTVNTTSASKTVTVTNHQHRAVGGLNISIFGNFQQTNNCGTSMAAGASCTITVNFTPTASGERTGAVILSDNGNAQPQTFELDGTGK